MNAVIAYNGYSETRKYYGLEPRQFALNETYFDSRVPGKWQVEFKWNERTKEDRYLGMTPNKYLKIATNNIPLELITYHDYYMAIYDTKEACEQAIRNLLWYLIKRDYT